MTVDEFRNALRTLLNDAVRGGLNVDDLLQAADEELHPAFDLEEVDPRTVDDDLSTAIKGARE